MEHASAAVAPVAIRRPAHLLRLAGDERLVALVRAGDDGAFEALYARHHGPILGFCRHMLGSREEAEDAVQHTFLAAYGDLVASTKPIELRAWLFAIARNRCLSMLRARRPHVALELAEPSTDGLAAAVERREDVRELLADLARLPEDQRAALLLAELGALDHAGIATVLGCPREKVKALVFQARTSLAASREARATPCEAIRVELASASGGALRRGPLRRHLRDCDGCRAFKAEVASQRKLLALALPAIPSAALKTTVLGGLGSAHGAVSTGTAGGTLGGALATSTTKVAISIAAAGAVAGGGALVVRHDTRAPTRPATAASHAGPTARAPVPDRLPHAAHPRPSRLASSPQPIAVRVPAALLLRPSAPSLLAAPRTPPSHVAPGDSSTAAGVATPPAQPGASVGSTQPPPPQASLPPGQGGAPRHGGTPPGQDGRPPGQSGTAGAGNDGSSPGRSGDAPGQGGTPPGHSGAHGDGG